MRYRDLIVWQKAMDLVIATYRLSQTFPASEKFGLADKCSVLLFPSRAILPKATPAKAQALSQTTYRLQPARLQNWKLRSRWRIGSISAHKNLLNHC